MAQQRVLVLAGRGRYEDPWHDHVAVAHRLASILTERDCDVTVRSTFPDCAEDIDTFDLVIVNGSLGRKDPNFDGTDEDWMPCHEKFKAYAENGGAILVYHVGINTFTDSPYWYDIVGGRWNRGVTYHPPLSDAHFHVIPGVHPITEGMTEILVFDERYTLLEPADTSTILVDQHEAGCEHASVWVNEHEGRRVVFDSMGHFVESLDSPTRLELFLREVNWLLKRPVMDGI
ncbi:ThuA domain-containing protein [Actinomyces vulturis]|uniref:ThuA domain-containing protein n=1 Tax=Actinomyces vulturis TaxID=1857645 RepID=UPI000835D1EE|nr:ThuA domain-containing protein [Actinomyces vulturis]